MTLTVCNTDYLIQELSSKKTKMFGKESTSLVKAKKMLSQCMDVISLQQQGSKPLLKVNSISVQIIFRCIWAVLKLQVDRVGIASSHIRIFLMLVKSSKECGT